MRAEFTKTRKTKDVFAKYRDKDRKIALTPCLEPCAPILKRNGVMRKNGRRVQDFVIHDFENSGQIGRLSGAYGECHGRLIVLNWSLDCETNSPCRMKRDESLEWSHVLNHIPN